AKHAGRHRRTGPGPRARERERCREERGGLETAAGPQVEEVDEVRGTGDEPSGDEHVESARGQAAGAGPAPAAAGHHGGGDDRRPGDAEQLDRPGGDLSPGERTEVTAQALGRPGAGVEVV